MPNLQSATRNGSTDIRRDCANGDSGSISEVRHRTPEANRRMMSSLRQA
jgi:hypothetical protein